MKGGKIFTEGFRAFFSGKRGKKIAVRFPKGGKTFIPDRRITGEKCVCKGEGLHREKLKVEEFSGQNQEKRKTCRGKSGRGNIDISTLMWYFVEKRRGCHVG
jgi:hypothetical protein